MGCTFNRASSKGAEEITIRAAESEMGFDNLDCEKFDMSFSRYAYENYLNENQLKASIDSLGLDGSKLNSPPYSLFFKYFEDVDKGFSLKRLVCAGILLGKGAPERKGELIFQNYDRDLSGELEVSEFKAMIDDMVLISYNAALELAKNFNSSMSSALDEVSKKLRVSQKIFSIYVYFLMSMGKDDQPVTSSNFLSIFKDPKMQMLSSTSGIRRLALELYDMQNQY